jgi:hypothetical protein
VNRDWIVDIDGWVGNRAGLKHGSKFKGFFAYPRIVLVVRCCCIGYCNCAYVPKKNLSVSLAVLGRVKGEEAKEQESERGA